MLIEWLSTAEEQTVRLSGAWCAESVGSLEKEVDALVIPSAVHVWLDASQVTNMDLTGAWFVRRFQARLDQCSTSYSWRGTPPPTVEFVQHSLERDIGSDGNGHRDGLRAREQLGRLTLNQVESLREALDFTGRIGAVLRRAAGSWRALRAASITRHVYEAGLLAIPIVALIAFLISVIVAYIGAQELKQFGGEVFVVDLVSVSVLRELGVLLTSIIVAGRSGSSYAAEIGVMQLNEEVDALRAMGVDPVEVLVLPRILGLVLALPLLTVIADAMGIAGGAVLSWLVLGIPFNQFAVRMQEALSPTTFWAGLIKAPIFAILIAAVGTYRGLQVRDSSRELGRLTTQAVVESIFLVLLADAIFAVVYWEIDF